MKGLMSTAASRAWVAFAALGLVVVALVFGLALLPRLGGGQELIDAAEPAMTDPAVEGEVAAANALSAYVDLAHPLMTRRGKAADEVSELVAIISRRIRVSPRRARAFVRSEAPHTEALLRALPLSAVADERVAFARFLSQTLNVTPDELQDELARSFPRLFQTLAQLSGVTSGWYDVPGIEAMTSFGGEDVRTMRAVRNYVRDDLIGTLAQERDRFQYAAGWGGIGSIPQLLLIIGIVTIAFGLLQARRAAADPPGRPAWRFAAAIGVLIVLLVVALQYFPRLDGADKLVSELGPAFEEQRVTGLRAGTDLIVQTVRFGDPIATPEGGAADEYPRLLAFVSERSGLSRRQVRGRLQDAAPRTAALLEAIPLSAVADEVPDLFAALAAKLRIGEEELVPTLERRTPALAQALLAAGPATSNWNRIPGTEGLERFDGTAPVRSLPAFAAYLDGDLVPVIESQRGNFERLADTWPGVNVLAPLLLGLGLIVAIYSTAMMIRATEPPGRGPSPMPREPRRASLRRRRPEAERR